MADSSEKDRRRSANGNRLDRRVPFNPRLFVSLLVIVVLVPALIYVSITRPRMRAFGLVAIAAPLFLILFWIRRKRDRRLG